MQNDQKTLVKMWTDFIRKSFTQLKKNNFCLWNVYFRREKTRMNV